MTVAFPRSFFDCQKATLAARARTGDSSIGTRVGEDGTVQVVRVTYPKKRGYAQVEELSGWLPAYSAIDFLTKL